MTPSEIITTDIQRHGIDPQVFLAFMARELTEGKANLIQAHDSVLFLVHLNDGEGEFHFYTADDQERVIDALKHFLEALKHSPIKRIYGEEDSDQIVPVLEMMGLNIQPPNRPGYKWMAEI